MLSLQHPAYSFLNVGINGRKKFEHQGSTMTADTVYFRYGVYRSFISRYKSRSNNDIVPTQIALFANVKKAATREALK